MSATQCPVVYCHRRITGDMVTCHGHWFMVPGPLRARIRDAYAGGQGKDSPAYTDAITAAVSAVDEQIRAMVKALRP